MNFDIYTFEFSPIISRQLDMYDTETPQQKAKRVMEQKNDIFDTVIDEISCFKHRGKDCNRELLFHQDNIAIMRLANLKTVHLEKDFKTFQQQNEPSCLVVIDNRKDVQRIAIEHNRNSYSSTDTVRNIMQVQYRKALSKSSLNIEIRHEYEQSEFWDYCKKYQGKIQMIRFVYKYDNLGGVHEQMKKLLGDTSKNASSTETRLEFNGDPLTPEETDEIVSGMANDSAQSGNPISIKVRGVQRFVKTGEKEKSLSIDEIDFSDVQQLAQLLEIKLRRE